MSQFTRLALLLKTRELGPVLNVVQRKIYSNSNFLCLRRDLAQPFEAPTAKTSIIAVRPIQNREAENLFDATAPGLSAAEIIDRTGRMGFFRTEIPMCYVAIEQNGQPCYAQWLMRSVNNNRIQQYFHGAFPILAANEALLEGAFTPEQHRGKGIMPRAMALIAESAGNFGVRYVITFVAEDNIASLKGCQRAGFVPYMLRKTTWRLLRPRFTFLSLSEEHSSESGWLHNYLSERNAKGNQS
jgi:hypothetical protein